MIATALKWLAKAYALLMITAIGGFVGANIVGLIAGGTLFLLDEAHSERLRPWLHGGWVVGAGLFLCGALTKQIRVIRSSMFGLSPTPSRNTSIEAVRKRRGIQIDNPRPVGVLLGIVFGGFGGTLLGGALGGSFLLLWFSLAYSPFAPAGWASSVTIEKTRVDRGVPREQPVATTQHPVALYAFFGPVALGAAAGAVFGGICAAKGKAQMS